MDPSKKTCGAWLVHHTKKLDTTNRPGGYKNIRIAGKAGILLSALSENEQVVLPIHEVEQLARASGVDTAFELPVLLDQLRAHHLISSSESGIEILGLTSGSVLHHTADIFTSMQPSSEEQATLDMAEKCSEQPHPEADLREFLGDNHKLSSQQINILLTDAEQIGLSDYEVVGSERLYFNGSIFRRGEVQKAHKVLASLKPSEQRAVEELDARLATSSCLLLDVVGQVVDRQLLEKLLSIGMYELNEVSNSTEHAVFLMKPASFCKFGKDPADDAFDLARALVASLSYGIHRSTPGRGRIALVDRLLRKLIAGQSVGPATAIGEDYKILELKKVVRVRRQGIAFSMQLLKREIGEIALAAITQGDASEHSLGLPGAAVTTYRGPEEKRMEVRERKHLALPNKDIADMLHSLRSGK